MIRIQVKRGDRCFGDEFETLDAAHAWINRRLVDGDDLSVDDLRTRIICKAPTPTENLSASCTAEDKLLLKTMGISCP